MADEVNVPINLTVDSNAQKRLAAIQNAMKGVEKSAEATQAKIDKTAGAIGRMHAASTKLQKINIGRAEGLTQSAGRALSGLGASALGGALGGAADVMQLGGVLSEAAKGAGLLSAGVSTLVPAALIAAPAVAGIALAVDNFNKTIAPSAAMLGRATQSLDAYYSAIATGTTESIRKSLEGLKIQKQIADDQITTITNALGGAFQGAVDAFGGDLGGRIAFGIAGLTEEQKALYDKLEASKKASADLTGQIDGLERAMGSAAVAANDAKAAFDKETGERIASIKEQTDQAMKLAQFDRTATQEQVQDRLEAIKIEQEGLMERLRLLQEQSARGEPVQKAFEETMEAMHKLGIETNHLMDVTQGLTDARAAEADLKERDKRLMDTQKRYNDDVASIEERALEQRAALQERYNDQIVDIAKKAADDAASALRKLTEQREDLSRDLGRDLAESERNAKAEALDIRIQAQREDEQAAREHYRNLERIRRQAEDREFELIMNRDFLGLFMSRRQTSRDLEEAGGEFAASKQERQIAATQELSDLQQQIQRERNERLIAYQQSLQDAQVAYNRERMEIARQKQQALILAQQQYNQELTRLSAKVTRELQIRQRAYDAELQMAATFGQARINAEAKVQQALLAQAQSRLAALNPPSITNNTARTVNYAPTYNVTGGQNMSPQQLAQYVDSRVARTMVRLVG